MRKPLFAMLLACGVCGAHAGNLVYVGAGVVRDKLSNITTADGFSLSDIDRTSWKVLVGLRPISLLGVEANYIDLGGQSNNFVDVNTHAHYKAFAGYAVGFLPIPVPFLDVFGKAGLGRCPARVREFQRCQHQRRAHHLARRDPASVTRVVGGRAARPAGSAAVREHRRCAA